MTALSCQVVVLSTPGYNSMVETDHNNPLATRERKREELELERILDRKVQFTAVFDNDIVYYY